MPQTYGALCALAEQHGVKMTEEVRALLRAVEAADAVAQGKADRSAYMGDPRLVGILHIATPDGYPHRVTFDYEANLPKGDYPLQLLRPSTIIDVKITIPEDWPTNEMIEAGRRAADSHGVLLGSGQSLWHVFRDMLAAGGAK